MKHGAIIAVLALLVGASSASGLVITGGPTYSLPGGGSCIVSGITSTGSGAIVSCTGIALASHTNVYFGIRNDLNVNGNTMTGAAPGSGSAAVFRSSSTGASNISYTSTTTVTSNNGALGTDTVTSTLSLSVTGGAATVVATGGTPANNGFGDIGHLFRITSGSVLTLDVDVLASDPHFSGQACPAVYDPTHATSAPGGEISKVDVAFYFSDCGDAVVDSPEQCDQGSGTNGTAGSCCNANCTFKTNGTVCTDDGNVCTTDTCNGVSAICQHPAGNGGTTCRASGGPCDLTESCTGSSPACPADAKSLAVCRTAAGVCDVPESCDGTNNACPFDSKSLAQCRASAGLCDVADFCDGVNVDCPADAKSTAQCRASAGACDLAESCDGVGNNCPADAKSTAVCRASAGGCDVTESCDGVGDNCPADVVQASGVTCRGAAGVCDVTETCDGVTTACPADGKSTALCRGSAGVCDNDDFCDGVGNNCPADGKSTALCRASADVCDLADNCDGVNNACPADAKSTAVCRAAAGGQECDAVESCDGINNACPADGVVGSGTPCRPAAGVCDVQENCDGVGSDCPTDVFEPSTTECRADTGDCDVADFCTGSSADCPADAFEASGEPCGDTDDTTCTNPDTCDGNNDCQDNHEPNTVVCRAQAGGQECDAVENCDGAGNCPTDGVEPSGTVCRPDAGDCDEPEVCDGANSDCPTDIFTADGDPCGNPLDTDCSNPDECLAGACDPANEPTSVQCRAASAGLACDAAENCDGAGNCPADIGLASGTICRGSAGVCDVADTCDGSASDCPVDTKSTAVCRASSGSCDLAESCNGVTDTCPTDLYQADNTPCPDGLFCNGNETCQIGVCTDGADPCSGATPFCTESTDMCSADGCAEAPLTMCRTAQKSLLLIKNNLNDDKDKLVWKWIKGAETTQAEFADPINTAQYSLCIYEDTSDLAASYNVAPGSNWTAIGTKGFKYFDASSSQDGIQKAKLKGGAAGKAKALVKGRGMSLKDPINTEELTMPVKVQLINQENGICFEANYSTFKKNTTGQFKAKQ